jgi:hypothetical protein
MTRHLIYTTHTISYVFSGIRHQLAFAIATPLPPQVFL